MKRIMTGDIGKKRVERTMRGWSCGGSSSLCAMPEWIGWFVRVQNHIEGPYVHYWKGLEKLLGKRREIKNSCL